MAKVCQICGKGPVTGNNVSHAHNKTKRRQLPNLQSKRLFVRELNRWVRVRVSTRAIKSIDKKGLLAYLRETGLELRDISRG